MAQERLLIRRESIKVPVDHFLQTIADLVESRAVLRYAQWEAVIQAVRVKTWRQLAKQVYSSEVPAWIFRYQRYAIHDVQWSK